MVRVLFIVIAYHCVKHGYIDPATPRVLSYSVLGSLALALIALKVVAVRWVPRWMERIGVIGGALFAATTGTVLTSALWYFVTWIRAGARPGY